MTDQRLEGEAQMAFTATAAVKEETREPAIRTSTSLTLDNGAQTRMFSFYLSDNKEHVALVFPAKDKERTPLVRLHSACLTGDVFGSAQCDCGDQIREAINRMSEEGGILLYLDQEGRGIGLYNKLDAYKLQRENGMNTYEANRHLGFEEDERCFQVGAEMLQALGVRKVRLLTGNRDKVIALEMNGIEIKEVIPTERYEKLANKSYLESKQLLKGHNFK